MFQVGWCLIFKPAETWRRRYHNVVAIVHHGSITTIAAPHDFLPSGVSDLVLDQDQTQDSRSLSISMPLACQWPF